MFTKTVEHDIMQCAGACALMNNTCNAMHFEASNNTCTLAEVGEKLLNILIIILIWQLLISTESWHLEMSNQKVQTT